MAFIESLTKLFAGNRPAHEPVDQNVLLFSLDEVPNPRDTGTMYVTCETRFQLFLRVSLDQAGIDATLVELSRKIEQIRASGFTEIRFDNVSPEAQKQIEAHLASYYIPSRDGHSSAMV